MTVQLCEAIVRVEPDQGEALHLAGVARHQQGDLTSALDFFRRAATLYPNNPQNQTNLGAAYDALDNFDDALACFRRALQLDPHMGSAHYNAANILRKTGRVDDALRIAGDSDYRHALRTKILAAADRFFNDRSAIREFEDVLERAAR